MSGLRRRGIPGRRWTMQGPTGAPFRRPSSPFPSPDVSLLSVKHSCCSSIVGRGLLTEIAFFLQVIEKCTGIGLVVIQRLVCLPVRSGPV
jgi:hypothetical protein